MVSCDHLREDDTSAVFRTHLVFTTHSGFVTIAVDIPAHAAATKFTLNVRRRYTEERNRVRVRERKTEHTHTRQRNLEQGRRMPDCRYEHVFPLSPRLHTCISFHSLLLLSAISPSALLLLALDSLNPPSAPKSRLSFPLDLIRTCTHEIPLYRRIH